MTYPVAIVSREFGIPCLVGTGNATSELREKAAIAAPAPIPAGAGGGGEAISPKEN